MPLAAAQCCLSENSAHRGSPATGAHRHRPPHVWGFFATGLRNNVTKTRADRCQMHRRCISHELGIVNATAAFLMGLGNVFGPMRRKREAPRREGNVGTGRWSEVAGEAGTQRLA